MSDIGLGIFLGFLAAGFIGYAAQQLRVNHDAMGAADKPMKVTIKTEDTPAQVVSRSHQGCIAYYFWICLLGTLIVAALAWLLGFLSLFDPILALLPR